MVFETSKEVGDFLKRNSQIGEVIAEGYKKGLFTRKDLEKFVAMDAGQLADEVLKGMPNLSPADKKHYRPIVASSITEVQELCRRLLHEEVHRQHLTRTERLRLLQHLSDTLGDLNDPSLIEELGYGRLVPFVKKAAAIAAGMSWYHLSKKVAKQQQEVLVTQTAAAITGLLRFSGPQIERGGGEQGPAPG
ncbi:MAG: hypothetical protein QXI60_05845 [Thermofilaceae archaeon]